MSDAVDVSALQPPAGVLDVARTLLDAGFETWCVGGAVRDALLGRPNSDWDIATAATPQRVQRLFRRTVPVGLEFGTVGVIDRHGVMHEVTTFRHDVETDGRHAVVAFGASLEDDLARRDFTVNAIAFHPTERRLFDPFHGVADLERGIIRAVGDAGERMREDRLRALRAIRFAARFGFALEGATRDAVAASAPFLGRLSPERVRGEMEKTMDQTDAPSAAFTLWRDLGAFAALIPALADVSDETLATIDCLARPGLRGRPQRRVLRIAALFAGTSQGQASGALKALRFSNLEVAWISALVGRLHDAGPALRRLVTESADSRSRVAGATELRRIAANVGRTRAASVVRLAAAGWSGEHGEKPSPREVRHLHRQLLHVAYHDAIELADLAIDGDDLRSAGIPPGPRMGEILAKLLQLVIADPSLNTRTALLDAVGTTHG